jgi:hypothetical protein
MTDTASDKAATLAPTPETTADKAEMALLSALSALTICAEFPLTLFTNDKYSADVTEAPPVALIPSILIDKAASAAERALTSSANWADVMAEPLTETVVIFVFTLPYLSTTTIILLKRNNQDLQ